MASAGRALLGITPGWQQARIAFETQRLLHGEPKKVVGPETKRRAAFAGAMRRNLVAMLDELVAHRHLGITSTGELFGARSELLHTSSALRYPVFKAGKNFTGHDPDPLQHPFLLAMIETLLVPELASVPDALIVPLGKAVECVLEYLTERGLLRSTRWLRGFPHPSGANGHRKRHFELHKRDLTLAARRWLSGATDAAH